MYNERFVSVCKINVWFFDEFVKWMNEWLIMNEWKYIGIELEWMLGKFLI